MNNLNRQYLGLVVGFVIAMFSYYLLAPLKSRYFFGIFLLCTGMILIGICAYHLSDARDSDKIRKIKRNRKEKKL